jgi:hypothetical protein
MMAPLACLEHGPGVKIWAELANKLGIQAGEPQVGSFIREFRNKAFREPSWTKAPNSEARREVRDELLWGPERRFMGAFDERFTMTLGEIEEEIRKNLLTAGSHRLRRVEGAPVTGFKTEDHVIQSVVLGSGEEIPCSQVIFADRWSLLLAMEGVPKALPFLRKRDPMGVLQASFVHNPPLSAGVQESFYAGVHRESGEEVDRHVWGYFSQDGKRSTWTICLSSEQVEDNHEIAKKFRRMKATLDKIFAGNSLIGTENKTFAETVVEEQVRFAEEMIFAEGESPQEPIRISQLDGIQILTDGYGPSWAMHQVGLALGIEPRDANSQTENMNPTD